MYKDTRKWIESCDSCNTKKNYPDKLMGQMQSFTAIRPWQIVGADLIGPLPRTKNGNRYILTFTDHFTK